jgi:branched-chain amino acid transport system substrate-binding protein
MPFSPRSAAFAVAAAGLLAAGPAAAKTIKIGLIAPFSGPTSLFGISWRQAVDVFLKTQGDTIDGDKIEVIERDLPGPDPLKAKALAQELVVKQGCQFLAGLAYSPNALALGAFANQAKVPIVIFNAATSSIIDKSPYFLRVSYTLPQVSAPEALYAYKQGFRKMVSMVEDYAPGWDAEKTFAATFDKAGGNVIGKIRMPLSTTDYVPYIQRAKTMGPQAIFGFLPGGGPTYEFLTAYNNSGLRDAGVTYLGQGETAENDLPHYGNVVLGLTTISFVSADHQSKENSEWKAAMAKYYPKAVYNAFHVTAHDGMQVIYHMIKATHASGDVAAEMAAARGYSFESPRGPVKIDPKSRDGNQNVDVRKVEKDEDGKLYNKELAVFPMQPDFGRAGTPIPTLADDAPQPMK